MATIVAALGGNAILQRNQRGTAAEQMQNVEVACLELAELICKGHRLIITHGNGPQVGNILLQNEEAHKSAAIPPMPLDVCGAQSQGLIGYMLQRSLGNRLKAAGVGADVVTVVTQVLVDSADPAFSDPTKPVGRFYDRETAKVLAEKRGYAMREDALSGWRRVVPSPDPVEIVEMRTIRELVDASKTVIASGGGGIPVVKDDRGFLTGVEAVIDKDLAAERMASGLSADILLILTDVEKVALDYASPNQRFLDNVTAEQMSGWQGEGHFKAGSMGPKVRAALRFLEHGGQEAIITSLEKAKHALTGAGTHITRA